MSRASKKSQKLWKDFSFSKGDIHPEDRTVEPEDLHFLDDLRNDCIKMESRSKVDKHKRGLAALTVDFKTPAAHMWNTLDDVARNLIYQTRKEREKETKKRR